MINKPFLLLAIALIFCKPLGAQVSPGMNAAAIQQSLKKLNTVGSVLYIAAHPDDENTRLLAWLAAEKKVRTAYLSITRGDGGQNLVGSEQGEALGLLRTQELLAARRTDGAEQFFTRANDFGYSKNPEETFRFWNRDSVLHDVVLTIRRFKPDIIICRFPTTGEGGHGHHTASAMLALEAFEAAADPTKFPSQLKEVTTWKTKSVYWNTFNFGGTNTTSPNQLKADVGVYNALLGKNYGEIAAASRSMHKSQGFGSLLQRGSGLEYFKYLKGDSAKSDLFESINLGWGRLPGGEQVDKLVAACLKNYSPEHPENSVESLVKIYKAIQQMSDSNSEASYWKKQKLKETEALLLACSGLWIEALATDYTAIPGEPLGITLQVICRNSGGTLKTNPGARAVLKRMSYGGISDSSLTLPLKNNELYTFKRTERLPLATPLSCPYWLSQPHTEGMYTVHDQALIGKPENDPALVATFNVSINDLDLVIERPVMHKYSDPAKGEIYRPLEVLPPVTLSIPEKVFAFTGNSSKNIQVLVKANMGGISGNLELTCNENFSISIPKQDFVLKNKGDELLVDAVVTPMSGATQGKLRAAVRINTALYNKTARRVEYDHIPYQLILSDAVASLVNVDLKKTITNVAYVPGAGDDVAACLRQVGYNVTVLTDEMLGKEDLSKYDAIVTGVRAYNTNTRLQAQNARLMDYVKNGGNLLVQYNTNSRVGPLQNNIGPYPFTISRERVTNENAEIRFADPKHPALNSPNIITAKDFEGWIQERGIYFATEAKQYEKVLLLNDPGEKEQDGSLIVAKYGKGNFVYTGLVFFRELPAGVPGAYRLFANLLSLPKN